MMLCSTDEDGGRHQRGAVALVGDPRLFAGMAGGKQSVGPGISSYQTISTSRSVATAAMTIDRTRQSVFHIAVERRLQPARSFVGGG